MGNPNVSGVGPNWYLDGTWPSGTVNTTSADYDTALFALQTTSANYLTAKNNLLAVINSGNKASINAARTAFDTQRGLLSGALNNMRNANDDLAQAAIAARANIDSKFDDNMSDFASDLINVLGRSTTTTETTNSALGLQFNNANNARITARSQFFSAIADFFPAQNTLNASLVNFQVISDSLLSAQAKYQADLAPPPASAAVLAADLVAITNLQNNLASATTAVNNNTATRDSFLATFKSRLDTYQNAIDAQIALLNQGSVLAQTSAANLILDLQSAKSDALNSSIAAINAAANADTLLHNQLLANYPTTNPILTGELFVQQTAYIQNMENINNSTLAGPAKFITEINVPTLPSSGQMSMSQLMQFITLVSTLLDQLIREIRRTDSQVNELRLTIFSASGKNEGSRLADLASWGNKIFAADTKYNQKVSQDNAKNTQDTVYLLEKVKDQENVINQAIDDLNNDIDDQNDRGEEVVTALNSAIQMAADNYKVQLWADHTQLTDYYNQLQAATTQLASSNPAKVPLQNVVNISQTVLNDLRAISGLLSVRPIDVAAIAAAESQLAASRAALTAAIGALPVVDSKIQSMISGLNSYIPVVVTDQTALYDTLYKAEVNAALALNTQVSAEAQSFNTYQQDLTAIIATLPPGDPLIAPLADYRDYLQLLVAALNTLSSNLTTLPINLATLNADLAAVNAALTNVNIVRNDIPMGDLEGVAKILVLDSDETRVDLIRTTESLNLYITSTTTTPTFPPDLPGQVRVALMPPPIRVEHIPDFNAGDLTVPAGLPLEDVEKTKPGEIQAEPEIPFDDIAELNKKIELANQLLAPVIDRLHADGHTDIDLIPPITIRNYITVRDPSSQIDMSILVGFFLLIAQILAAQQSQESTNTNPPTNSMFTTAQLAAKPNLTSGSTGATGVGAGMGMGGANLFSGNISTSLNTVMSSTQFSDYVKDVFQKIGVVGGLAALKNISESDQNLTDIGLFPEVAALLTPTTAKVPSTSTNLTGVELTAEQNAALTAGVGELLNTVGDVPQLKQDLLAILKSLGAQSLSEEEINQLLSLLLFLLQLLALLVGSAAVVAGGGGVSIDSIVEKAFGKPEDTGLATLSSDLSRLGVKGLPPDLTPASPQFIPVFFNAVNDALTPAQQVGFVAEVTAVFIDKGVTVDFTNKPLGTAVQEALATLDPGLAGKIRTDLTRVGENRATELRSDILGDDTRRPTLTSQIQALNPEGFAAIPKQQFASITNVLNNAGPTIPGLSTEDRNTLVVAVLAGVITPDQAKVLVDQFLSDEAFKNKSPVASLLSAATQDTPVEPGTVVVSRTAASAQAGRPGELPDNVTLITNVLKTLAKQTDDDSFLKEVVTRFADTIREQSDFYQKSLTLLLDPANTYVKNFSIMSRQTSGHDGMDPVTQIPISG